jgi:hypothetical protein
MRSRDKSTLKRLLHSFDRMHEEIRRSEIFTAAIDDPELVKRIATLRYEIGAVHLELKKLSLVV